MPNTSPSGFHTHNPFFTQVHQVKVAWDTDMLTNIECGSKKGSKAYLDIHVINRIEPTDECIVPIFEQYPNGYDRALIYDYIPTEVAQFCKQYTIDEIKVEKYDELDEILQEKLQRNIKDYNLDNCIKIQKVRIASPRLDPKMQAKFEAIELEEKDKALAIKRKDTERVRQEALTQTEEMIQKRDQASKKIADQTAKQQATAQAERQAIVDQMKYDARVKEAKGERKRLEELAAGQKALFDNPDYIKLKGFEAAHSNSKLIFGNVPENALVNMGGFATEAAVVTHHINTTDE